ncbi:ssl1498 family light-harvesting-like protein [Planktothrix agardhii 1032]|uniref:photosystem II assembly protein Psb34 n=1 Tax=Planktothrix agardhii TaxID=1160 RepID=UPI001D0A4B40|nr:ssl1498 family light-harvesting-like protein [Planktothrix agardhii]MCB8780323.1 ssl1498 family light-harvesting-like protein [Planktothrix agardhii 1031]MCF3600830.1 ssl1498 family light-harvesting-like protein [Planktothrix agardhii 1032]
MRTTNENGILNNYATEPKLYFAEYPSPEQQSRYALQASAVLLLTSLILIAFAA